MVKFIKKTNIIILVFIVSILIFERSVEAVNTRPTQLYMVDRVRTNSDYATLASWGINSAVVAISTNGSTSSWQNVYNAAHNAGVGIIIWPLDPNGDNECGWESPFTNPNDISKVHNMLDWWANKPGVLGIVTFHEPMWESSSGCRDSISDLSTIYNLIHSYTNNPNFEIYGYVNNIDDVDMLGGFRNYTDLDKIMDVGVTWKHCAGNAEAPCEGGSYSALGRITNDRSKLASVNSRVKLVYIMQTFTAGGGYGTKFTLSELQNYSCDFLNTSALDGFGYYTWDEGWYSGNLKKWPELRPAVSYIYNTCVNHSGSSTPTITATTTPTPTNTQIPVLGDANGDEKVDGLDFIIWLTHYYQSLSGPANGDFNNSGNADGVDYVIWLNNYLN